MNCLKANVHPTNIRYQNGFKLNQSITLSNTDGRRSVQEEIHIRDHLFIQTGAEQKKKTNKHIHTGTHSMVLNSHLKSVYALWHTSVCIK